MKQHVIVGSLFSALVIFVSPFAAGIPFGGGASSENNTVTFHDATNSMMGDSISSRVGFTPSIVGSLGDNTYTLVTKNNLGSGNDGVLLVLPNRMTAPGAVMWKPALVGGFGAYNFYINAGRNFVNHPDRDTLPCYKVSLTLNGVLLGEGTTDVSMYYPSKGEKSDSQNSMHIDNVKVNADGNNKMDVEIKPAQCSR